MAYAASVAAALDCRICSVELIYSELIRDTCGGMHHVVAMSVAAHSCPLNTLVMDVL